MSNPVLALDSSMVFTLPSNASQALYPENTVTDFRVALPERVALPSNDYEVALASFTYDRTWYNVPDLAGQTHMAIFTFPVGHLHPPPCGDDRTESAAAETEGTPSSYACEGSTFIKSRRTLSPEYYEHVRQILHDLNGHGRSSRIAFQFSYHATQNRVLVTFRPGLKDCTGRVTLSRALSLLLGWPDQEMVLMGRGNTCHMAPSQPRRDPVESRHLRDPVDRRCSRGGQCQELAVARSTRRQIVCYEPQGLDWLPMHWRVPERPCGYRPEGSI